MEVQSVAQFRTPIHFFSKDIPNVLCKNKSPDLFLKGSRLFVAKVKEVLGVLYILGHVGFVGKSARMIVSTIVQHRWVGHGTVHLGAATLCRRLSSDESQEGAHQGGRYSVVAQNARGYHAG